MKLGHNISMMRTIWKLQQSDLATLLDVNSNMISNYENGKSYPRLPLLLKLEEITGIPIYDLCTKQVDVSLFPSSPLKEFTSTKQLLETEVSNVSNNSLEDVVDLQKKLIEVMEENRQLRKGLEQKS